MTGETKAVCGTVHRETGAECDLLLGHEQNHRGRFAHGIAQWPHDLHGPAGGARGEAGPSGRDAGTPQSTGTLQWTLDNIYTIARREYRRGEDGKEPRPEMWAHILLHAFRGSPADGRAAAGDEQYAFDVSKRMAADAMPGARRPAAIRDHATRAGVL